MTHAAPLGLTLATRESRLAMWQAEHVRDALQALGHQVRLMGMTTRGDQILDRSLSKVGGKGLFVKELEVAMQDGHADLAVHSLKDVPMDLPEGFELACVMAREDPHDAWVSAAAASPVDLPEGAVLGTSSLRRTVLLRDMLQRAGRADVRIEPLRGNLDTRLRKLDEGQYQGIVLAASGLKRLGLEARIRHIFSAQEMLPAAGQGALGIEIPVDRPALRHALRALSDEGTWLRVAAERAVSRSMGGSCSMPLAAYATWVGEPGMFGQAALLQLDAAWGEAEPQVGDHGPLLRASEQATVAGIEDAEALGLRVAAALRAAGAH